MASVDVDSFTGDGTTVNYTLTSEIPDEKTTQVYIDGVYQSKGNYSVSGTTLTFSTAPPNGTAIEVVHVTAIAESTLNGSGTANYVTKWQDADTLANSVIYDNGTNVGIGTALPSAKLHIVSSNQLVHNYTGASQPLVWGQYNSSGDASINNQASASLSFATGNTNRMQITSTGSIEIPNQNAINEIQFTGSEYTNIYSQTTSGFDIGTNSTSGTSYLRLLTEGTEAMRIDSSGRVGISATPSAWFSVYKPLQLGSYGATITGQSNDERVGIWSNIYADASNVARYVNNGAGSILFMNDGGLTFEGFGVGTTDATATGTPYFKIDSSGNVGIGTTSPTTSYNRALHINDPANSSAELHITAGSGTTASDGLSIIQSGVTSFVYNREAGNMIFGTSNAEQMRIDSSGQVGIGGPPTASVRLSTRGITNTSSDYAFEAANSSGNSLFLIRSDGNVLIGRTNDAFTDNGHVLFGGGASYQVRDGGTLQYLKRKSSDGTIIEFYKDSTLVGSISTNSSSLPSDRNFKRDISDLELGLDFVSTLNPKKYRYNISDDNSPLMYGVIAQDLEQSLLDFGVQQNETTLLQYKEKEREQDSEYHLDYLKITPILINAIKELKAEIETLKSQINP